MILQWLFNRFSESKKIDYIRKKGIMLGSRVKEGRMVYIYMLRDFFVEVMFLHDNIEMSPEKLVIYSSLDSLNDKLEKEFRQAF